MKKNEPYLFLSTCLISTYSFAEESWLNWQSNSISALYGKGFEVEPDTHETITFEHASNWKWGDLYLFVDTYWFDGEKTASQGHNAVYTEIAPRFSIGKLTNTNLSFGPVKDVLIATSFDLSIQDQPGYDDMWTYIVGPGFELEIKGFDYFTLNFYYRIPDDGNTPSGQWQITPSWSYTVPFLKSSIIFDGYIDWVVNSKGNNSSDFHFNPQIKYDLSPHLGLSPKKLAAGIEYDYWKNKFLIEDTPYFKTNQNATSFIVKYTF